MEGPGRRLRGALARGLVIAPGTSDALSALLIESHGFEAMCLGGLVSAARLGTVEQALTITDLVTLTRTVTTASRCPVIIDGETGFGGPVQIERTVRELEAAGAAGVHIEDGHFPRHMRNSPMISIEAMIANIRAAKAARVDPDFLVIARTEAWAPGREDFDDVRRRLTAYAEQGVDALMPMVFDPDLAARVAAEFAPRQTMVFVGGSRRGNRADLSANDIESMGYRILMFATIGMETAVDSFDRALASIRRSGLTGVDLETRRRAWEKIETAIRLKELTEAEAATRSP